MSVAGPHIRSTVAITTALVILSFILTRPLLPIGNETKISLGYPEDSLLNFTELTHKYNYLSEEHVVTTEDGYILRLFRITKGRKCYGQKKTTPVLLMHGLLQSSDSWLDSGPNSGLPYLISDSCYDIWLGNNRGNYYSRRHVTYDPDKDSEFWKFSTDEIGLYDVPAMVDYILDYTGSKKLNYIGYSQGSTAFFIMCSEKPGYCEKSNMAIILAPASRHLNTKSILYRMFTVAVGKFERILSASGAHELLSKGAASQELFAFFCHLNDMTQKICSTAKGLLDAFNPGSITKQTTKALFGHFPAGTSVRNIARFGQSMSAQDFVKFDYGKEKNLKLYGNIEPPKYNLSSVSVPVVCMYGKNDGLVDPRDVEWLMKKLPNVVEVLEVKDPQWTHMDMTYSQYTNRLVYPKVNEYLSRYS